MAGLIVISAATLLQRVLQAGIGLCGCLVSWVKRDCLECSLLISQPQALTDCSSEGLRKPASDHGSFIDMTRSFNNRLGLWVREDVVEDVFGSLKHHCRSFGVVLADTNKKGLHSHLGKHRLLLRSIHMCAIFLKRVAELEVQNSCLSHGFGERLIDIAPLIASLRHLTHYLLRG